MVRGVADRDNPSSAWLLSMWLAPSVRGLGVGPALVEALVGWARERGFECMLLDVADDNGPAVRLYARMSFEPNDVGGSLPAPRNHVREHQRVRALLK